MGMLQPSDACVIWRKPDCLNPDVQGWRSRRSLVAHLHARRHGEPPISLSFVVGPASMDDAQHERIEGHEWGAYVALGRSSVTERRMARRAQELRGSRSANSTRGGNGHTRAHGKAVLRVSLSTSTRIGI